MESLEQIQDLVKKLEKSQKEMWLGIEKSGLTKIACRRCDTLHEMKKEDENEMKKEDK